MDSWPYKPSFFKSNKFKISSGMGAFAILLVSKIFPFFFDDIYWYFAKYYYRIIAEPKNCKNESLEVRRLRQFDIYRSYPKNAMNENIEGYVIMKLHINKFGDVKNVEIIKSSPNGIFEKNSIKTAKSMVFIPEYRNCTPVPSIYDLTVKFVSSE